MNIDFKSFNDSRISRIELDIESNVILIEFCWPKLEINLLYLKDLVCFNYLPDYTDTAPWECMHFIVEELNSLEELKQSEVLWNKNSGGEALKELKFPIYRILACSGDFELSAICQKIDCANTMTGEKL